MNTARISVPAASILVGLFLSVSGHAEAADAAKNELKAETVQDDATAGEGVSVLIDKKIKITTSEVDEMAKAVFEANRAQIPEENIAAARQDIRKNVIEQLTLQALLLRECDKASIEVTEEDREKLFSQFAASGKTVEQVAAEAGMSVEKFNDVISKNIRIEKLLKSRTEGLEAPTEADARARFDQVLETNPEAVRQQPSVEASHILIRVEGDDEAADAEAKAKIESIRKKLLEGGDFAELAAEYSDCPSKAKGGSLGQFSSGQMVKPFEDAAFEQEIGEIGEVVKTQFGYHVIRVDKKNEGGETTFEDVRQNILDSLAREQAGAHQREFLTGLREAAQIENLEKPVVSEPAQAAPRSIPEWAR